MYIADMTAAGIHPAQLYLSPVDGAAPRRVHGSASAWTTAVRSGTLWTAQYAHRTRCHGYIVSIIVRLSESACSRALCKVYRRSAPEDQDLYCENEMFRDCEFKQQRFTKNLYRFTTSCVYVWVCFRMMFIAIIKNDKFTWTRTTNEPITVSVNASKRNLRAIHLKIHFTTLQRTSCVHQLCGGRFSVALAWPAFPFDSIYCD